MPTADLKIYAAMMIALPTLFTISVATSDQIASTILEKMDRDVDPCSNFYQFACGKFLEKTSIPNGLQDVSILTPIVTKIKEQMISYLSGDVETDDQPAFKLVKSFYQACMDAGKIAHNVENELKEISNTLGGWPILTGLTWDESGFSWTKFVSKSSKMGYKIDSFFGLDVSAYYGKPFIIQVRYPMISMGINLTEEHTSNDPIAEAYLKYMTKVVKMLGGDGETVEEDLTDLREFVSQLIDLYQYVDDVTWITVNEMDNIYPDISWTEYLNEILALHAHVDENTKIKAWNPNLLKSLFQLIEQTPKRVLANYGIWRIIQQSIEHGKSAGRLADAVTEYESIESSEWLEGPRQDKCFNLVREHFPLVSEAWYTKYYYNKNFEDHAQNLVKNIRATLHNMIEQAEWMDSTTKKKVLRKLDRLVAHVGYVGEPVGKEELNEYYQNFTNTEHPESFLLFLNSLNRFEMEKLFSKVGKIELEYRRRSVMKYLYRPRTLDDHYVEYINEIDISHEIVRELFNDTRPNYMNYGALGWLVGREMVSVFGGTRFMDNIHWNKIDWWETETREKYWEKVNCLNKRYDELFVEKYFKSGAVKDAGNWTRDDNVFDNTGLKTAYVAYNEWNKKHQSELNSPELDYTPQQMFWISAANMMCQKIRPELIKDIFVLDRRTDREIRVVASMSNMPEFSRDFNCPTNSNMNPSKKCTLW